MKISAENIIKVMNTQLAFLDECNSKYRFKNLEKGLDVNINGSVNDDILKRL